MIYFDGKPFAFQAGIGKGTSHGAKQTKLKAIFFAVIVALPDKLGIQPPVDTTQDLMISTPNNRSRYSLDTKPKYLNVIVPAHIYSF